VEEVTAGPAAAGAGEPGRPVGRRVAFGAIIALLLVAFLLVGLKVTDILVLARMARPLGYDRNAAELAMSAVDIYPYDGGHTQPNFIVPGSDGALWSGDHGFFVDLDLDRPPAKEPDELRLVLIGASGAAGWGAQSNYNMVYHRLEQRFNETRPCGAGAWLRVINLAMGGSTSYQNFIALNRWGHPLAPDAILAYTGLNDLSVTLSGHLDAYPGFPGVADLVEQSRYSASPAWVRWIGAYYPGIMRGTSIGVALRSIGAQHAPGAGHAKYAAGYPDPAGPRPPGQTEAARLAAVAESVTKPWLVHAFRSIKRDFAGTPIVLAWEAYTLPPDHGRDLSIGAGIPMPLHSRIYADLRRTAERELAGYVDDGWHFFDTHEYYHAHLAGRFPPGDGVHLSDAKAAAIADLLAGQVFPVLCRAYRDRSSRPAASAGPVLFGALPARPLPRVAWHDAGGRATITVEDGGTFRVTAGAGGAVESVRRVAGGTRFSGWAADRPAGGGAAAVVVLANGRVVGRGRAARPRDDIASGLGPAFRDAGWEAVVAADGSLAGRLCVFVLSRNGTAQELAYAQPFPFAAGCRAAAPLPG
jgi:hypothetical protein